jgi:hypothetical protein
MGCLNSLRETNLKIAAAAIDPDEAKIKNRARLLRKAEFEQPVEKAPMFRTISKLPSSLAFRPGRLLQAACLAEEPQ